jgi:hypothetical protein
MRPSDVLREMTAPVVSFALVMAVALSQGCSQIPRTPPNIRHVTAAELGVQHPACLQTRATSPPKAFLVRSDANWKKLWGPGEDPPVINFEKSMVFVAASSLGSDGPGTLEIWVLKFRETDELVEVQVKEDVTGEWSLSAGWSRAYEIVKLPRSAKPVKVTWRYVWGSRDEQRELRAVEWAPRAGGQPSTGGWPIPQPMQGPTQTTPMPSWPAPGQRPQ